MSLPNTANPTNARYSVVEGGIKLSPDDSVVLVMGATGAGKSSFIQTVTGRPDVQVGGSLSSCTSDVGVFPCDVNIVKINGKRLVLVDTPGFGDNRKPEAEFPDEDVLETIAIWLAATYKQKITPSGILYLQNIDQDPALSESSRRHCQMLQKLVGKDCLKNVLIVSTMWREAGERGRPNEDQLRHDPLFWKHMLHRGSRLTQYHNDHDSALKVLGMLEGKRRPLLVQEEMVTKKKELSETAAGMLLYGVVENEEATKVQRERHRSWSRIGEKILHSISLGLHRR